MSSEIERREGGKEERRKGGKEGKRERKDGAHFSKRPGDSDGGGDGANVGSLKIATQQGKGERTDVACNRDGCEKTSRHDDVVKNHVDTVAGAHNKLNTVLSI